MDKETARYIVNYYSSLLTSEERMAIKHTHSQFKLDNRSANSSMNDRITEMYKKHGWLTEDESILDLLKDGYDNFELKTAERILSQHSNEVFLNYCPSCNMLARTPYAKQCRHCGFDWHTITENLLQKLRGLTTDAIKLGKLHTWNEIPSQCKYILTEIRAASNFSNFHEERMFYRKENLKKKNLDLESIVSILERFYTDIFDINVEIFRVEKGYTVIDIRYFLKSSVDDGYYEKIKDEEPMFHAKLPIPPYIFDSQKEKFDINWQFNRLKYRWNMFKAKRKLEQKNK